MMPLFMWIVGGLIAGLVICVGFIVNGFKNEMKEDRVSRMDMAKSFEGKVDKIEAILQKFTDEFIDRLHKVENSTNKLWTEHHLLKANHHDCVSGHHHERSSDNAEFPYRRNTDKVPFCLDLNKNRHDPYE